MTFLVFSYMYLLSQVMVEDQVFQYSWSVGLIQTCSLWYQQPLSRVSLPHTCLKKATTFYFIF